MVRYDPDTVITVHHNAIHDAAHQDLLTQAMSELTQSIQQEFRAATLGAGGEIHLQRVATAGGNVLQVSICTVTTSNIGLISISMAYLSILFRLVLN